MEIQYPAYWQPQTEKCQLFDVPPNSSEFKSIEDRFHSLLKESVKITEIKRNQNQILWKWYQLRKQEIIDARGTANEKFLFHGSKRNAYSTILEEGFDIR